ncbi:MAG: ATP-binding protein [Spirochaetes bacterium]|jgi:predicted kinase|nr:ATP-binding protein [Spirochaetota bacterium]
MDLNKFHSLDIILVCGLYGSGKNEFAVKFFGDRDRGRISRSDIRKSMYEMTHFGEKWSPDRFTEENDSLVKHIERKAIEHFIFIKKKILIINTFVTKKSRRRFVDLAKENGKTIGAIFLNRGLDECIGRNEANTISIPKGVIQALHSKIELPDKTEGFNELLVVTFK